MSDTDTTIIHIEKPKSTFAAFLLAFLFGPLGLLYATISGGLIMIVLSIFVMPVTGFLAGLVIWPVCWIWALLAAGASKSQARKARAGLEAATGLADGAGRADTGDASQPGSRRKSDND